MEWIIPGTVLEGRRDQVEQTRERLSAMFLGGGIVRSQVVAVTGLEPHAVQNWVKRGFLSHPVDKRYSLRQLSRILIINALKSALSLDQICALLGYVNGQLDDESDDRIDDTQLYFAFLRLAAGYDTLNRSLLRQRAEQSLEGVCLPDAEAKERVLQVLQIMLTAWASANLRRQAEEQISRLGL